MATVVKSAVKEIAGKKELRCSGDLFDAIDKAVTAMIEKAASRAAENGRKTIRACDL